ncbi:hypothetical protein ACP70R_046710 [Stipagrostis hirtigluma subsp. patula]
MRAIRDASSAAAAASRAARSAAAAASCAVRLGVGEARVLVTSGPARPSRLRGDAPRRSKIQMYIHCSDEPVPSKPNPSLFFPSSDSDSCRSDHGDTSSSSALMEQVDVFERGKSVTDKDIESDEAIWALYERWCKAYNKERDHAEMMQRFYYFNQSVKFVHSWNETFVEQMILGEFADDDLIEAIISREYKWPPKTGA